MATGRAFGAGLISTATKVVENIFNSARFELLSVLGLARCALGSRARIKPTSTPLNSLIPHFHRQTSVAPACPRHFQFLGKPCFTRVAASRLPRYLHSRHHQLVNVRSFKALVPGSSPGRPSYIVLTKMSHLGEMDATARRS